MRNEPEGIPSEPHLSLSATRPRQLIKPVGGGRFPARYPVVSPGGLPCWVPLPRALWQPVSPLHRQRSPPQTRRDTGLLFKKGVKRLPAARPACGAAATSPSPGTRGRGHSPRLAARPGEGGRRARPGPALPRRVPRPGGAAAASPAHGITGRERVTRKRTARPTGSAREEGAVRASACAAGGGVERLTVGSAQHHPPPLPGCAFFCAPSRCCGEREETAAHKHSMQWYDITRNSLDL